MDLPAPIEAPEDVDLPVVDLAERVHPGLDVVTFRQCSDVERQSRVACLGERLPRPRRRRGVVESVDRRDEARHEERRGDRESEQHGCTAGSIENGGQGANRVSPQLAGGRCRQRPQYTPRPRRLRGKPAAPARRRGRALPPGVPMP